jgi:hypothetical protein
LTALFAASAGQVRPAGNDSMRVILKSSQLFAIWALIIARFLRLTQGKRSFTQKSSYIGFHAPVPAAWLMAISCNAAAV